MVLKEIITSHYTLPELVDGLALEVFYQPADAATRLFN